MKNEQNPKTPHSEGGPERKEKEQLFEELSALIAWMENVDNWDRDEIDVGGGEYSYEPIRPDFEWAKKFLRAILFGDNPKELAQWQEAKKEMEREARRLEEKTKKHNSQ